MRAQAAFAGKGNKALDNGVASTAGAFDNILMNGQEVFKFAVRAVPTVRAPFRVVFQLLACTMGVLTAHGCLTGACIIGLFCAHTTQSSSGECAPGQIAVNHARGILICLLQQRPSHLICHPPCAGGGGGAGRCRPGCNRYRLAAAASGQPGAHTSLTGQHAYAALCTPAANPPPDATA